MRLVASSRAWGARDADEVARRCVGTAIIGMARWDFKDSDGRQARLPTEFNHYEGALARTLGLPTLVHQVSDWCSGAAANFDWMREAKRENTRCGL
jgi:hypothetical protein